MIFHSGNLLFSIIIISATYYMKYQLQNEENMNEKNVGVNLLKI